MLFENLEKSLNILKHGQHLDETKEQEQEKPKEGYGDILESAKQMQDGVVPDVAKGSQEAMIKKLLEVAVKEEDQVDQKEGKTYLGMSGETSYYAVINQSEDGTLQDVTVYDVTDDEVQKFSNEEEKSNVEMLYDIVQGLSLDSISFRLLDDLGVLSKEEEEEEPAVEPGKEPKEKEPGEEGAEGEPKEEEQPEPGAAVPEIPGAGMDSTKENMAKGARESKIITTAAILKEAKLMAEAGALKEHVNEVAPKGWEKTIKKMKKSKDVTNPWALSWWMKKKGYKPAKESYDNVKAGDRVGYYDEVAGKDDYGVVVSVRDGIVEVDAELAGKRVGVAKSDIKYVQTKEAVAEAKTSKKDLAAATERTKNALSFLRKIHKATEVAALETVMDALEKAATKGNIDDKQEARLKEAWKRKKEALASNPKETEPSKEEEKEVEAEPVKEEAVALAGEDDDEAGSSEDGAKYKKAIEEYEYYANGFNKLSGTGVEAKNIRVEGDRIIADVTLTTDAEAGTTEGYSDVTYTKELLAKYMKESKTNEQDTTGEIPNQTAVCDQCKAVFEIPAPEPGLESQIPKLCPACASKASEGKAPDTSKEIDDKFIKTLTEEKQKAYNDKLEALLKQRQDNKLTQTEYDDAVAELQKEFKADQEGAPADQPPKDVEKREKQGEIKKESVVKNWTAILMGSEGEVDRTSTDEKNDQLAWDLFKEFAKTEGYQITDDMRILWEEGDEIEEGGDQPTDEEVNAKAWEMFKQHWNALSSEEQDEVYKALGFNVAESKKRIKESQVDDIIKAITDGTDEYFSYSHFHASNMADETLMSSTISDMVNVYGIEESQAAEIIMALTHGDKKNEGVEVSTSKFEFAHGKKPKGKGSWAFKIGGKTEFIPGSLDYGVAKSKAIALAKEKGVSQISVAEATKIAEASGKSVFATFGPGKYFIGDPCYVMDDALYDKWGKETEWEGSGEFTVDGHKFACDHTAYGDGGYPGSDGNEYSVDAGIIGIVPEAMWKKNTEELSLDLGTVVDVKNKVTFSAKDGFFEYNIDGKQLTIATGEEEDEGYDEDEENESQNEGKAKRGKRDGTGSYKGSDRARKGLKGRRAAAGEKCPAKEAKVPDVGSESQDKIIKDLLEKEGLLEAAAPEALKALQAKINSYPEGPIREAARAYADSIEPGPAGYALRNLEWEGTATDGETLIKQAEIIGSYNEFDVDVAKKAVEIFGPDVTYRLGRESSVVLYIESDTDFDLEHGEEGLKEELKADEVDWQGDALLRIWWD